MTEAISLKTPLTDKDVEKLKIGDRVLLSGVIYTGR
ncbi:MAG: TRZ/ATZ family protein, partial [Deltaproteobacteria bacterium]|nr:TRZ/ATZ family protein [Deltaproteobacteria bacterium]